MTYQDAPLFPGGPPGRSVGATTWSKLPLRPEPKHLVLMSCFTVVVLLIFFVHMSPKTNSRSLLYRLSLFKELPRYPHKSPKVPKEHTMAFAPVKHTKTLLLSAYQEHRTNKTEVRIISVVLRSENASYRCLFRCGQQRLNATEGVTHINRDHFGYPYGTADIMCPLPSGCESPTHVSVVSGADEDAEDAATQEYLEIKDRNVSMNHFPYNFTVCYSTMFRFDSVLELVQSLTMLQILGVNKVVIYKSSCSPETQRVLDHYMLTGFVEVISWTLSKFLNVSDGYITTSHPGDIHYHGQMPALNDCLYRNMYRSRYVAFHDVDELILPREVDSWPELLPLLEKTYGVDKCYEFENNVFPKDVVMSPPPPLTAEPPPAEWANISGVDILAHFYQEPIIKYIEFKIIVNPRAVYSTTVHGVIKSKRGCAWVHRSIARMHHTRAKRQPWLKQQQLIYDGRLQSYGRRLRPGVTAALRASGLLPGNSTN